MWPCWPSNWHFLIGPQIYLCAHHILMKIKRPKVSCRTVAGKDTKMRWKHATRFTYVTRSHDNSKLWTMQVNQVIFFDHVQLKGWLHYQCVWVKYYLNTGSNTVQAVPSIHASRSLSSFFVAASMPCINWQTYPRHVTYRYHYGTTS